MSDLGELKIKVDVDTDEIYRFSDAVESVASGAVNTTDAIRRLKAQVEKYQDEVNNAKEGTKEWEEANRKLKESQEELGGAVSANGRLEFRQASEAAKKLADDEKKAAKEAENATHKLDVLTRKAVVFLGQYFAIKKSFAAVMSFAKEGEELARMADMAGTSANQIEKLSIALKNYGGSASSASSTLSKLNQQMEDLKYGKGGKLGQASIRYGLNINAQTPEQMLLNIAKRMEGLKPLQQLNLGRMLGLDDATIMLLQQGVEGVKAELSKAGKYISFSDKDVENAQKMNRAYRDFENRIKQLKATMARDLLPIFQTIFERLEKLAQYLNEHPKILKGIVTAGAIAFGGLLFWLHPLLGGITLVSGALIALYDDFKTFQEGGKSLLNWDNPFLRFFRELIDVISKCTQAVGGFIAAAQILLTGGSFEDAWNALKSSVDEGKVHDYKATITTDDADKYWNTQHIKDVPFKGRTFGHKVQATELGEQYVTMANNVPLNSSTSNSIMYANNNNQKANTFNVGEINNVFPGVTSSSVTNGMSDALFSIPANFGIGTK